MSPEEKQLYEDAIKAGLVVFAPRSLKNLRDQYPELGDRKKFPEFQNLSQADMMFCFLFRAACSPYADWEDKDKLEPCVKLSYRSQQVRAAKLSEWVVSPKTGDVSGFKMHFPPALAAMSRFNASARIIQYQAMMTLQRNCLQIINNPKASSDKEYIGTAAAAMKALQEIRDIIEGGSFGVEQSSNTILASVMGSLADHRSAQ